ncbi:hypothetical protein FOZ62_026028 [Perkinsus olseni]|uniref:Nodulin-like domain-containing protein n=1 Tax=Perkinsus olseni TaxID=32597 RepID=A0A7J6QF22_PEROL|nr:hypothetical protein FOZ62_026028 [Perkinsus olseni]
MVDDSLVLITRSSRWRSLSVSFILVLLAGVGYCFPLYSDVLMTALGMSRSQLTLVPALLNVGGGLVAPAGLCITKLGLRTAILVAGGLITVGYVGMYTISTSESVQSLLGDLGLVTVAYVLAFVMGHGSGWLDCIGVTANTTNYPAAKGQVTGITKCIFGLAAPTVTLLFTTLHGAEGSPLTFLLLVAFMVLLIIPLASLLVAFDPTPCPSAAVCDHIFSQVNILGLTLALLQIVDFFLGVPKWLSLLMVVSLFALMIALPVRAERHLSPTEYTSISPAARTSNSYYYIGTAPLKSALFWAAFVGLSAAFGGGLAFINNQAQLIPSDIPDRGRVVGALLTVVTATSAASRVLTGWVADRSRLLPRPGYVIILIITMAAAFTLLSRSSTVRNLFICGPMIGFCFGGMWALTPPLCVDLFGDHHLPLVYSSMRGTLLVGALLISSATTSIFYTPEELYSRSFSAITVILLVAGLLPWLWIFLKTRTWYSAAF